MAKINDNTTTKKLSLDFIAGLICGQGSFCWVKQNKGRQNMAVFQLRLPADDQELAEKVRDSLNLKESVHIYTHSTHACAMLIVRKRYVLDNIIIPAFKGRLHGLKKKQFQSWKERFYQEKVNWKSFSFPFVPYGNLNVEHRPKDTKLSVDFTAGLICGQGYFGWIKYNQGKRIIPLFQLQMPAGNRQLIEMVRDSLDLKEPVHEYSHRSHYAKLLVRKRNTLENIIIPAFDGQLLGVKQKLFDQWKDRFAQEKINWKYRQRSAC